MRRPLAILLACALLVPTVLRPQDPSPEPQEPPDEAQAQEPAPGEPEPDEAPSDESTTEDAEPTEPLEPLTPKQEEAKRKAAERAAKREARQVKRQEKRDLDEAKQAEKDARQAANRSEKADEQADLGYQAIGAQKYKAAVDHFEKVKELEGGRSFAGELGLASAALAQGSYAQAVQLAQGAVEATPDAVRKAEALALAARATLAARPLIEGDPERPMPGTEMFADTAMRFYIRAVELAPTEPTEARAALDRRFGAIEPSSRATRLLDYYLTNVPDARRAYGTRVAATYEALLSGSAPEAPLAVVGPVSAPRWRSGQWPKVAAGTEPEGDERPIVSLVIEPDGRVSSVKLLNGGDDKARDKVIVDAMRQWIWEPARLPNGQPVRAHWLHYVELRTE